MNIGIVGSGMIVKDCLEAINGMEQIRVSAICVREHSLQKGQELADQYQIENIYTHYEAFLQDPEIEVVYIGIINSEHFAYAKQALLFAKHVVLEKPFTLTVKDAKELAELAKEKKLFLFEAITTLYFPNYEKVRDSLAYIGDIKMIQCNFSQYSSRYDRYLKGEIAPAFDLKAGGGALYDLNVYHIHFVLGLFGVPGKIYYKANIGHNGVDTSGVLLLEYPQFSAECVAAKDSTSPHFALIQGTKGYLKVDGQVSICPRVEVTIQGKTEVYQENTFSNRMQHEWNAFANYIAEKDYNSCYQTLDHTVEVMKVLEQACQKK